ncbi:MAG: DUF2723 domain-containing protein [Bacteroidota bacterium]
MDYNRINNFTGWGTFLVALVVYLMTMAPTASYWDCGEFIACANELEVPHPPGAPFFLLVGRIFAMLAGPDMLNVAFMLNLLSVLSSAFTVLFTTWITTYLAKRLLTGGNEETPTNIQTLVIMAAGVVGGLANTFADSFWFNAVEAEVYAMSSFFTAVVVWLMFKWEARADEPGNERWIVLIAYLMGLSIGVHLLNLLTIPALAFIYYFKKYDFSWTGFFVTSGISVAILGVIQTGIIIYTFDIAWSFERALATVSSVGGVKSGLGLPVGSGLVVFFLLLFGALAYGVYYSAKNKKRLLNLALMSTVVIFIGFSSYLMVPIRSNANPAIDENNPDATHTFISYMKREQYGNRPLLKGPLYNARAVGYDNAGTEYILDTDENGNEFYRAIGEKVKARYAAKDMKWFPRMYESGRYNMGPHGYVNYVRRKGAANTPYDDKPTSSEDIKFFWNYQVIHMYWRYFMWNFAGKQGDTQDMDWESGLFTSTSDMPDFIKNNPAKNHFYLLPFLLGLFGLVYQTIKRRNDAIIVGLLFFFTGFAIIIYLNQYPMQPRERDYSFAGSFQTFAIWIGLAVPAIYMALKQYLKDIGAYVGIGLGLFATLMMGIQGWDDHSRADRYVAPDSAYNLLNSLAPNAVLFTNGDNDTFPLWYAQEVEQVRPDVRVLCLSYVNTDWYIDQMYQKVNDSPPLPLSISPSNYRGQTNQSRNYGSQKEVSKTIKGASASDLVTKGIIGAEDAPYVLENMSWKFNTRGGQSRYLELKDVLLLNLLENTANQGWERPIYFANTVTPSNFLKLDPFLRQEGLAYRILPLKKPGFSDRFDQFSGNIDKGRMYDNLMNKFRFRNLNKPGTYFDENIIRMVSNYHNTFHRLIGSYMRDANELERGIASMESQIAGGSEAADSLQSIIDNNKVVVADYRSKANNLAAAAEEKFPLEIATPEPYLIVRTAISWNQLGNKEKADKYFNMAKDRVIQSLKYYYDSGATFPRRSVYVQTLNYLTSLALDPEFNRPELAQELQQARQSMPKYFGQ